jgi:hypothetical protein
MIALRLRSGILCLILPPEYPFAVISRSIVSSASVHFGAAIVTIPVLGAAGSQEGDDPAVWKRATPGDAIRAALYKRDAYETREGLPN